MMLTDLKIPASRFSLAAFASSVVILAGCAAMEGPSGEGSANATAAGATAATADAAAKDASAAPPAPPVQTTVCAAPTEVAMTCKLRSGAEVTLCAAPAGEQAYLALLPVGVSDVTAALAYPSDPTTYRQSFFKEGVSAKRLSVNVNGPKGVFASVASGKKGAYNLSFVRGHMPQDWVLPKSDLRAGCKGLEAAPWMAGFAEQLPVKGKRVKASAVSPKRSTK